jgi:hypothetical protein
MTLLIQFVHLIETDRVKGQAELARLAHVSRARLTQVMDLLLLAMAIQEATVFETGELTGTCGKTNRFQGRIVGSRDEMRGVNAKTIQRTQIRY